MRALWVLLGLVAAPAGAADLRLQLRPHLVAADATLVLGQVAKLASDDLTLLRSVVDLPIGRAPAPGRFQRLQRARLESLVRAATRHTGATIVWSGPSVCDVEAGSTTSATSATSGGPGFLQASLQRDRKRSPHATGLSLRLPESAATQASAAAPANGVARSRVATLRSGTGSVVAETRVEVLQDGDAGQTVLVRSLSSPAPLSARVVGPDQLEIDR